MRGLGREQRSTRPTSRLRPPSQHMTASSGSRRWCTSKGAAKEPGRWRPYCTHSAARKISLAVLGTSLQSMVRTERQPSNMANPEVVDRATPGHVLQLVAECLPDDDQREATELPHTNRAPLYPCRPHSGSSAS